MTMNDGGVICTSGTQLVGRLSIDPQRLAPEIKATESFPMDPSVGYGVGSWCKCLVWASKMGPLDTAKSGLAASLPMLMAAIHETFRVEAINHLQIFSIKGRGFILPHRDWVPARPLHTRLHIPLQTNEQCLHAEEASVFHMSEGEAWVVDASLTHSAANFSEANRIHVVVDFDPEVPVHELFRVPGNCESAPFESIDRPKPTSDSLDAIYGLAEIASARNFQRIADMLATVHYDRQVNCAAMYDWLSEIAHRSDEAKLVDLAAVLQRRYLGPFDF